MIVFVFNVIMRAGLVCWDSFVGVLPCKSKTKHYLRMRTGANGMGWGALIYDIIVLIYD